MAPLSNISAQHIVGRNMLRAFGHPVVTFCNMLGDVRPSLKMVKFLMQHLWMWHNVLFV